METRAISAEFVDFFFSINELHRMDARPGTTWHGRCNEEGKRTRHGSPDTRRTDT